jgi:glucokinase
MMSISLADTYTRLVGDIGGTNARFAMQVTAGMPISEPVALHCRDFAGPADAILHYLEQTGLPHPRWAGLAIATAISGDMLAMTNSGWKFSISETRNKLALSHLRTLNDFTALALALPQLGPDDRVKIGSGTALAGKSIGLIGPGTGLGVSGLVPSEHGYSPIEGEGGHATLPAFNAREAELIALASKKFPHVSAERLISGPGLELLYEVIAESGGATNEKLPADEISRRGVADSCPICRETMDTFCAMLGTVAADVALVLGARGGVYIGGGIIPRLGDYFATSPFRKRFEEKGRFSSYLAQIPTWVILAPWPGLIGAASALNEDAMNMVL